MKDILMPMFKLYSYQSEKLSRECYQRENTRTSNTAIIWLAISMGLSGVLLATTQDPLLATESQNIDISFTNTSLTNQFNQNTLNQNKSFRKTSDLYKNNQQSSPDISSDENSEISPQNKKTRDNQVISATEKPAALRKQFDDKKTIFPPLKPSLALPDKKIGEVQTRLYQVKYGDSLGLIADNYNVPLANLIEINNISNPNIIEVNQLIVIPNSLQNIPSNQPIVQTQQWNYYSNSQIDNSKLSLVTPNLETEIPRVIQENPQPDKSLNNQNQSKNNSHTEKLRADIIKLRQEYQTRLKQNQVTESNKSHDSEINKPVSFLTTTFIPQWQTSLGNQSKIELQQQTDTFPQLEANNSFFKVNENRQTSSPVSTKSQDPKVILSKVVRELAKSPITPVPAPIVLQEQPKKAENSLYINKLRAEVVRLRQEYHQKPTQQPKVPTLTSSTIISSESTDPTQSEENINNLEKPTVLPKEILDRAKSQSLPPSNFPRQIIPNNPRKPLPISRPSVGFLGTTSATGYYQPPIELPYPGNINPEVTPNNNLLKIPSQFNGYIWPAKGLMTSGYGWRWGRMHKGIDIANSIGTPVVAAAGGEVISAGWNNGGFGNLVEIKHTNGSITVYAHNSRILVRKGQIVEKGQQISAIGSTGYSTGPHLHFEVHPRGKDAVNPIAFLPKTKP